MGGADKQERVDGRGPSDPLCASADTQREDRALREGAALLDQPAYEAITVDGEDGARFLHGLTTGDISGLAVGGVLYTLVTDDRGHVLSDAIVWREGARRFHLLCEPSFAVRVLAWFEAHRIADRVTIGIDGGKAHLGLEGLAWRQAIEGVGCPSPPEPGGSALWRLASGEAAAILGSRPGAAILCTASSSLGVVRRVLEGAGFVPVREAASERARVEDGRPRAGFEFDGDLLPMEIGLEGAVSFTKGCYAGQEVIARASHRGRVRRTLAGIRLVGTSAPDRKTPLLAGGESVGWITSAVVFPEKGVLALACVRREWAGAESDLHIVFAGVTLEARISPLPFRTI
jgi:folate-binding protein YgfZ